MVALVSKGMVGKWTGHVFSRDASVVNGGIRGRKAAGTENAVANKYYTQPPVECERV